MMPRKRVVFLMSDTGGGHRSTAGAIRDAMALRYPGDYEFALVDVYRRYTPFPFRYMPEIYPRWVNWAKHTWGWAYEVANARYRAGSIMAVFKRLWRDGMRRLIAEHPCDVIVSVHTLFSRPVIHALKQAQEERPLVVSVVTDLVSTHAFAYDRDVDRCLVATQAAYDRGRIFGLTPEQLRITGLPVHPSFVQDVPGKATARQQLGWDDRLPAVLLTGGADGMGPVYRIARAINARRLPVQLIIIAGRNAALQRRLTALQWNQPTRIYPFVIDMPVVMAAADILVTKAGPSTICEACIAGLPMILSGAVPGQENGNVQYVVENGAGEYAPGVVPVAHTVADWVAAGPGALAKRSARARALGQPDAVWTIADEIHQQAQRGPVPALQSRRLSRQVPRLRHTPEDGWVL
ncbi:MAG: galactosyldiacylglycerol synthase [Anaerolineae bacterium]|nr:galactosyldiacylglycerol synthase [Anaerolineae bacterium]